MNEPGRTEATPYVPLGPVETIEDPRLVRIGDYEDGVTGRHDASRILEPFLDALAAPRRPYRMAVLLHDAGSLNKVTQTLLEMVRGGVETLPLEMSVFCLVSGELDPSFVGRAAVPRAHGARRVRVSRRGSRRQASTTSASSNRRACIAAKICWRWRRTSRSAGSTRYGAAAACRSATSTSPIACATRPTCSSARSATRAATSSASPTCCSTAATSPTRLSAVRAVRASDALEAGIDLTHKRANQYLLSRLLRRRAEVLELPVQFVPISPEKVKRTSALDGLQSLLTIITLRFK